MRLAETWLRRRTTCGKGYAKTISAENGARMCVKCGQCEEKCPQKLEIRNLLQQAAIAFDLSAPKVTSNQK